MNYGIIHLPPPYRISATEDILVISSETNIRAKQLNDGEDLWSFDATQLSEYGRYVDISLVADDDYLGLLYNSESSSDMFSTGNYKISLLSLDGQLKGTNPIDKDSKIPKIKGTKDGFLILSDDIKKITINEN